MKTLRVDLEILSQILPESALIPILPRKKKKALKKKISVQLVDLALEYARNEACHSGSIEEESEKINKS
jgi:hypothetical protein